MSSSEVQLDSYRKKRTYRSRACGNCRIRKIKCDGTRPSCSQCLRRPGRPHVARCHYPNAKPSESQNLEADIRSKEALLQELEEPVLDDTTVKLSLPYAKAYDVEQLYQLSKRNAEHDVFNNSLYHSMRITASLRSRPTRLKNH
ncbi:hypothetical protein DFH05DRAFT_329642 [Lentinula detonsa]|uniref:Zn(2)-C6 fungal-type domain-containing protein n=1 Tax=Lentinula detonsa TaxID=2804962 RepID=A0A9W8NV36_9AGAR|nr:hypothetical protein DFH05DRAFT_329642 [Lentinula detonsa]